MISKEACLLITISTLVGFVGDATLQLGSKLGMGTSSGWGLKEYFKQHGCAESLFIAGGMMGLFYIIYTSTGLPFKIQYMIIYGIILDLIFRLTGIFSSLKGYYKYFNYFWSAVWGAIPMVIPLLIWKIIDPKAQII